MEIILIQIQRMPKSAQKNFFLNNLEMFKSTYKVAPPHEVSWGALGSQLKIEQAASIELSIDQHTWLEQISSNPFVKTKQLFKNKNNVNSVIEDDLTNQHIFTIPRHQEVPEEGKNFEFDSFGVHNNIEEPKLIQQYPSNTSSQDIKAWNSSSVEINFGKIQKQELILPDHQGGRQPAEEEFMCSIAEDNDSSIKQFCFKLTETSQPLIDKTPIKKWSEIKQSRPAVHERDLLSKNQQKKTAIKKIILQFMEKLQQIPPQTITDQFIKSTKVLLDNIGDKPGSRLPLRERINESLQTSKRKSKQAEDDSSTLRLYTEESSSIRKTQRRDKTQTAQYHYKGKFKVYECRSKKKQNACTPLKGDKKAANKEKRFKF